jgi:hypothetical protein
MRIDFSVRYIPIHLTVTFGDVPLSRFSMTLTHSPVDGRTLYATDDVEECEEYQMFCSLSVLVECDECKNFEFCGLHLFALLS